MPRNATAPSVVESYEHPQAGSSSTLTLDENILASIIQNDIKRPKGYTVSYHTNPEVERHHFGQSHPMKPWRLTLTNKIVIAYGMHTAMDNYVSRAATKEELLMFHTDGYIDALENVTPYNMNLANYSYTGDDFPPWGFGDDCPIFDGMYRYCSLYTGASMDAARRLTSGQSDIAINWSGGLHHAKKSNASGFCYVNDIVNAILHLLLYHPRVLYIDIDVHHGDGVEQAFWSTDRVMTVSFHKYDKLEFFPGTGPLDSTGPENLENPGAHHSVNVPLNDGIEDRQYEQLFKDVIGRCMATYKPTAIVLQCGADSLGGDRLGVFNLNIKAHGSCVEFVKSFGLPLMLLGGGGYTPRNVSRLWAYETSVAIGADDLSPNLPAHTPFLNHFLPDRSLFPPLSEFKRYNNQNTNRYMESIVEGVSESLRYLHGAPSVQMKYIPPGLNDIRDEVDRQIKEEKAEEDKERKAREAGLGIPGELYRD